MVLMFLILIASATAMIECKEIMKPTEVPCMMIGSWDMPDNCTTYNMSIWNEEGTLMDWRNWTDFHGTSRCNTSFNYSTEGSYIFNTTKGGDSGRFVIGGDDDMAAVAIMIFMGILVVFSIVMIFYLNGVSKLIPILSTLLIITFSLNLLANVVTGIVSTTSVDLIWFAYKMSSYVFWTAFLFVLVVFTSYLKTKRQKIPQFKTPMQQAKSDRRARRGY